MTTVRTLLQEAENALRFFGLWEQWNVRAQHMTSNEPRLNYAHALLKEATLPTEHLPTLRDALRSGRLKLGHIFLTARPNSDRR